jgi:hypothetical protein
LGACYSPPNATHHHGEKQLSPEDEILSGAQRQKRSPSRSLYLNGAIPGETSVVGTGGHGVELRIPGRERIAVEADLIHGPVDAPLITRPPTARRT